MTYTLELSGFLGFDRKENLSLTEARQEWRKGKFRQYNAYYNGGLKPLHFTKWELFKDGKLVQSGRYDE